MRVRDLLSRALLVVAAGCSSPAPPLMTDEGHAAVLPEDAGPLPGPAPDALEGSPPQAYFQPGAVGKTSPLLRDDAPTLRYARLGAAACEAELKRRKVPFTRAEPTREVRSPVRLTGPLHGVTIHSALSEKQRKKASFEIFDCRLVVALDDFAELVAQKDVVEIIHMSAYRSRKQNGCTARYAGRQHCGALAVDVGTFVKKDGARLVVERDFNGGIGRATCAADAKPTPSTPQAEELWDYVCEAARRALFNVVLTPNFNAQHHNHFHLEVTPEVGWILVH